MQRGRGRAVQVTTRQREDLERVCVYMPVNQHQDGSHERHQQAVASLHNTGQLTPSKHARACATGTVGHMLCVQATWFAFDKSSVPDNEAARCAVLCVGCRLSHLSLCCSPGSKDQPSRRSSKSFKTAPAHNTTHTHTVYLSVPRHVDVFHQPFLPVLTLLPPDYTQRHMPYERPCA